MNSKNKIFQHFLNASMILLVLPLLNCQSSLNAENSCLSQLPHYVVIDSLEIGSLAGNENTKIYVAEEEDKSRIIIICQDQGNGDFRSHENHVIVDCGNCGKQSGDPYIGIFENVDGFTIATENFRLGFIIRDKIIFLQFIETVLLTNQSNGIDETTFRLDDEYFGDIHFEDVSTDFLDSAFKRINEMNIHASNKRIKFPINQENSIDLPWQEELFQNYIYTAVLKSTKDYTLILAKNDNHDDDFYTLFTLLPDRKIIDSLQVAYSIDGYPESLERVFYDFKINEDLSVVISQYEWIPNGRRKIGETQHKILKNGRFVAI